MRFTSRKEITSFTSRKAITRFTSLKKLRVSHNVKIVQVSRHVGRKILNANWTTVSASIEIMHGVNTLNSEHSESWLPLLLLKNVESCIQCNLNKRRFDEQTTFQFASPNGVIIVVIMAYWVITNVFTLGETVIEGYYLFTR